MGSKNKPRSGARPEAGRPPREEVDRLIAKGWYKDAVKSAKICYRDHPNPEHHRLLERAYLLRAQELRDGGMPTAAHEVASHLLDFGITDPELNEPAAALLIAVGMEDRAFALQGRLDAPEVVERLTRQAADQAVLHPERKSSAAPGILEGAGRIRRALEALELGDEPGAMEILREISRTSPFADWRLFARGLAAFRRGDDPDARANWDRLDPARAAARIARPLLEATAAGLLQGSTGPKLEGLERWAFGEPILRPLRELAGSVAQGLWPDAIRKLGPVRLAVRRVEPSLAVRLTEALYSPLLREASGLDEREGKDLIRAFTKAAEPLPIDPRWNRLWALTWDGPQGHPAEAEPYWRKYIEDLEASEAIRPEERPRARALVLAHVGEQWADLALELDGDGPGHPAGEDNMAARRSAVASLEASLAQFPSRRETYQALIDVFEAGGQPDRAAEAARRLLKALPDDLEALEHLGAYHFARDEPAPALEFILRARKLKPLDPAILQMEWASRVALSRHQAIHGRWDEARLELEAADRLMPELGRTAHFAARKASLEIKAGRPEVARAILDRARESLPEPAPLWLGMAVEARRFQLPKPEIDHYEALWAEAASRKVRGETAGAIADLMGSFLAGRVTYPGRDHHVEQVANYLGKTTRIKYARDDLIKACAFLGLAPGQGDLLRKLASRGLKLFPDAFDFPMLLGSIEMEAGPFRGDLAKARRHFETALGLAEAQVSDDPKIAEVIPKLKQTVSVLTELGGGLGGFPFPAGRGGRGPGGIFEAFREMMDDEELRDMMDDIDFPAPFFDDFEDRAPAPAPRPRGKKRKS